MRSAILATALLLSWAFALAVWTGPVLIAIAVWLLE